MSFSEIKKTEEDDEYVEEIKTHETRKVYSRSGLLNDIEDLKAEVAERQERIAILEAQLPKFKEVKEVEL
jgi:Tfp pilus assembly protein PilO